MGKRFLFTLWDGGGIVPPSVALGKTLTARGHSVRFLADAELGNAIEKAGCRHVPIHRQPLPDRSGGEAASQRLINLMDRLFGTAACKDLFAELEREPTDALVIDHMQVGALSAADRLGVPTGVLVPTIYSWFVSPEATARWAPTVPFLEATRQSIGLRPLEPRRSLWDDVWRRADLTLVLTPREFDVAVPNLPPNVRYVGPIIQDHPDATECPWPANDADPLVVASFSSFYDNQEVRVQRTIEALTGLPVRAMVGLGGLTPDSVQAVPGIVVRDWLPLSRVLEQAAVLVTHAGHGTVMNALAHGVPVLSLPKGRDLEAIADRVVSFGAGRVLSADADPTEIRTAVRDLIDAPHYRERARWLGAVIETYGNGSRAADELELLAQARTG